ncbi:MAG: hypothetical protein ACREVE_09520 [Gammaproteobacteria bacterium]
MKERGHWHQICATFSVKDHVREGAFIAEILLYDYLYMPTLATVADGLTKEEATKERKRWVEKGWDPAKQTQLVARLLNGPIEKRIRPIPWTPNLQAQWKERMGGADTLLQDKLQESRKNGYAETSGLLAQFAPAALKTITAVASCHTLEELRQRTGVHKDAPPERVEGSILMAVLSHELLIPDEPEANDYELLDIAAEVAADSSYRDKRAALNRWHSRFLADGKTDTPSVEMALEEMKSLVDDLNGHTGWEKVKHVSFFGNLACAGVAPFAPVVAAVGQVTAGIGQFWSQSKTPEQVSRDRQDALLAASLVRDAQSRVTASRRTRRSS